MFTIIIHLCPFVSDFYFQSLEELMAADYWTRVEESGAVYKTSPYTLHIALNSVEAILK